MTLDQILEEYKLRALQMKLKSQERGFSKRSSKEINDAVWAQL